MVAKIVYLICAIASICCAFLLIRGYRKTKSKLLLWCSLSFFVLSLNNLYLFVDLGLLPDMNLWGTLGRNFLGAISGGLLLFGLIWELT